MTKTNITKKVEKMTFEESLTRLEEIVETLSSQKINLDSMVELYEEGTSLKEHCNKRLVDAKMKIDTIK